MNDKHITLGDVEHLPNLGYAKVYYEENGKSKMVNLFMTAEQFSDRGTVFGLLLEHLGINTKKDKHYDNTKGSLYKFALEQGLNAYEFDIIKRVTRCRKKGFFIEDLEKTKRVVDLYLEEQKHKFKNV